METEIDEGFLRRVYRTSVLLWAVGTTVAWSLGGLPAIAGWTVGSALSIGVLFGFERLVRRCFLPGSSRAKQDFTRFSAAKLPIILLVLVGMVLLGGRSLEVIAAFCAGVVLTQAVIVLKTLGILIVRR